MSAEGERLRVNAPRGSLTATLREEIAGHKAEILQFLRDAATASHFAPPPISRVAKDQASPLSFAQERLWFLEQFEPGRSVYNICRAARLTGPLKVDVLETSLNEIVRRHSVLRSIFNVVDGRPVQITAPVKKFSILLIELHQLALAERDGEVARLISEEPRRPFNLSAGMLFRATLLRRSDDEHVLILTTHHIVSDAWSMGILTGELWRLYEALASGKPSPLQNLPVQYVDYALWQREWLEGEVLESQLSYWKQQLGESLPILNLPTDHPRPATQTYRGARKPVVLPQSLTKGLKELSEQAGVTLFMTLIAAFKTLLYRYTGQEDIVLGSPIANRNRTEIEGLIGFFVNTLVLRTDLSGDPTFKEVLQRVRDVCLGAYAHQDLPFEKLVEKLHPERDLSRNPLFQVMFILQNTPRFLPTSGGVTWSRVGIDSGTSKFDLSLALADLDDRLSGFLEYRTDLFESTTIERMVRHFETLLGGIVANPDRSISTLPFLTEAEQRKLLVEWNDTAAAYPNDSCIHELFEDQVERTPEAIAVELEGKQLTYRQLNTRANQLANYLRGLGVGPEKLVGICMERSLEMVIGLLGILKAGGAYVPLDPEYPNTRLVFMLEDAQVSLLLTQEKLVEDRGLRMEDGDPRSSILDPRLQVVFIDRDWGKIAQQSGKNPLSHIRSDNLAYVIYTSGSTGQPKGVQIEHRSLINCLCSMRRQLGLTEKDVLLAVTTMSFDIAALELYLPLIRGARVSLASRDEVLDGKQIAGRLKNSSVTVMQATPSVWKLLLDVGWQGLENFTILCGGEVLSRQLANQLLESGASVWNLYGPTETTIWSTTANVEASEGPVPIGRPIANTQICILDSHLQPVAVGVPGELYIGGDGVARGYLNRPELTAERFVPNPFSELPGSQLYRSGDWARYLSDGKIDFLGRVDNQVKIRGYRVELGEIEATLNQHPEVKESVVVAREDVTEEESGADNPKSKIENLKSSPRLVAYLVRTGRQPSVNELRRFLKEKLPEYMLPSAFVMLDALPLLPNGKVDRHKLARLDGARSQLTQEFVAPRSEIEELVAQMWCDVLKLEHVSIHDNFFELGGHSLLAVQIVARLRAGFNRAVSLREIFELPTIAALAVKIENLLRESGEPELPPIVPVSRGGFLPLSMNQEQLWRLDQMIPDTHFFNMPYMYRFAGELNVNALENTLGEITRRHEALRAVFAEVDGRPIQIIRQVSEFHLPLEDLRNFEAREAANKAADLILKERTQTMDLALGPLIRMRLLRLTDKESFLLVTLHHIISDHWSMQVFRRELVTLYEVHSQGRPSPLGDLPIQFSDYAVWERQMLENELLHGQLDYWKQQLADPLPELQFRKRGRQKKKLSFETSRRLIEVGESLFTSIKAFAREETCTPFTVVVTALNILLYFHTGQRDIRIGTLAANRSRKETEGLIGHFMNTVIFRTEIDPKMTCRQLLRRVRSTTLAAYGHQEIPFEQLSRILERERNTNRASLFQVLLRYHRSDPQAAELPGLTIAPFDIKQIRADTETMISTYILILDLKEMSTTLTGSVNYKVNHVDASNADNFHRGFESMLRAMVLHPDSSIASAGKLGSDFSDPDYS